MSHCPGEGKGCGASGNVEGPAANIQDSVFHVGDVSAFPKCFSEIVGGAFCFLQVSGVLVLWLRSKIRVEAGFEGDRQVALETPVLLLRGRGTKGSQGAGCPDSDEKNIFGSAGVCVKFCLPWRLISHLPFAVNDNSSFF